MYRNRVTGRPAGRYQGWGRAFALLLSLVTATAGAAGSNGYWPLERVASALQKQGSAYRCMGWIEMKGEAVRLDTGYNNRAQKLGCPKPEQLNHPGLFVSWFDETAQQGKLSLLIEGRLDESAPRAPGEPVAMHVIWELPVRGMLGTLRIIPTDTSGPNDIEVTRTALPKKGDRPFRPGPPVRHRYSFDGEVYVPKRARPSTEE